MTGTSAPFLLWSTATTRSSLDPLKGLEGLFGEAEWPMMLRPGLRWVPVDLYGLRNLVSDYQIGSLPDCLRKQVQCFKLALYPGRPVLRSACPFRSNLTNRSVRVIAT